jgi:hypothetical protein
MDLVRMLPVLAALVLVVPEMKETSAVQEKPASAQGDFPYRAAQHLHRLRGM